MRLRFLADDFTGASDVLLQCRRNGMEAAIVQEENLADQSTGFNGIATAARSLDSTELESFLRDKLPLFMQPPTDVVLYKICSTFDSSPTTGSIGLAVRLIRELLSPDIPVVVVPAQPGFGRYTVFGNHFAVAGGDVFRLDRHPVMSQHPSTPMHESDLRQLLHQQGVATEALTHVDLLALRQGDDLPALLTRPKLEAIIVDTLEETDLDLVATALIDRAQSAAHPVVVVGSGGIAGALSRQLTDGRSIPRTSFAPGPTLVLSGSRSPITQAQIAYVTDLGWRTVAVDLATMEQGAEAFFSVAQLDHTLSADQNLVIRVEEDADVDPAQLAQASGSFYADLITLALHHHPSTRIAVLGGDTSSWTVTSLHPRQIRVAADFVQAGPILSFTADAVPTSTPILLKGGQVGKPTTLSDFSVF
ncbi:four-carbon acid sugar kinase family protein [Actinomyces sp. MRS3W]|uniref:four-carbon acid sugar kinase family protein n=1 Tax=Actinomyces sp. MRS3W TaxID=2800796 RepID=UPI0028FDA4C3|nr:four-carbon acid sugar kinase family protein [Actinomyces sp. MRS3W]MDU0348439.1 four-carbon acid sugar kinase family protein [Actinomyces sp. MRS3W]